MNEFLDRSLFLAFPISISKSYIFYLLSISERLPFHCHLPDSNDHNLLPTPGISKWRPSSQIWAAAYFGKYSFIGTQTHQFIYLLSMTVFMLLKERSWVTVTVAKPKQFSMWPFTEKFANPFLVDASSPCSAMSRTVTWQFILACLENELAVAGFSPFS